MDFYFIHDAPLWMDILILIIGVIMFWLGLSFLKSGKSHGPWWLIGIDFNREKNPNIYWFFTCFWLGLGLFVLIIGIISIL
jgi:hypothetical protein